MSSLLAAHAEAFWEVECWRDGERLWHESYFNLITTEGKNALLDNFLGAISVHTWYVGLVSTSGFSAYAAADVMGSKGWTEFTAYSGATRPLFTPGATLNGSVDNTAQKATFTVTGAGGDIQGTFLTSGSGIGGISGYLYGEGDLSVHYHLNAGDTVLIKLTLTV